MMFKPSYNGRVLTHLTTGTTTVGIVLSEHVILGADKRATAGAFVANKNAEKIYKISDSVACTIAGGVADAQYLMDWLAEIAKLYRLRTGRDMPPNSVAKMLSGRLYSAKFPFPYQVHHLVAGVGLDGPKLYDVGGYGSILKEKYASTGSGSVFAYGVLEDRYSTDLDLDQGLDLVRMAVKSAISRDIASGNGIDIVIIGNGQYQIKSYNSIGL